MNQQRRPELTQDGDRLAGLFGAVIGDADIQRFALAHRAVERAHRLLERRLRIEAVAVEDVDVFEPHPSQLWPRLARRYLRDPPSPYGPGHMSKPALVETTISSRCARRSLAMTRPNVSSAEP